MLSATMADVLQSHRYVGGGAQGVAKGISAPGGGVAGGWGERGGAAVAVGRQLCMRGS